MKKLEPNGTAQISQPTSAERECIDLTADTVVHECRDRQPSWVTNTRPRGHSPSTVLAQAFGFWDTWETAKTCLQRRRARCRQHVSLQRGAPYSKGKNPRNLLGPKTPLQVPKLLFSPSTMRRIPRNTCRVASCLSSRGKERMERGHKDRTLAA